MRRFCQTENVLHYNIDYHWRTKTSTTFIRSEGRRFFFVSMRTIYGIGSRHNYDPNTISSLIKYFYYLMMVETKFTTT